MSVSRAGAGGAGTGAAGVRCKENVDSSSQETRQRKKIEMSGKERGGVKIEGSPDLDPICLRPLKFNSTSRGCCNRLRAIHPYMVIGLVPPKNQSLPCITAIKKKTEQFLCTPRQGVNDGDSKM